MDTHCDREVSEREEWTLTVIGRLVKERSGHSLDREVSEREEWTLTVIGRLVKERSGHSLTSL